MKVKIPREFKVGATKAIVSMQKNLTTDEGFNGSYNRRTNELCIDDRLVAEKRNRTFGHELMEVIKENYELKTSEEDMSCIANGWIEFLYQLGIEFDYSEIKEK